MSGANRARSAKVRESVGPRRCQVHSSPLRHQATGAMFRHSQRFIHLPSLSVNFRIGVSFRGSPSGRFPFSHLAWSLLALGGHDGARHDVVAWRLAHSVKVDEDVKKCLLNRGLSLLRQHPDPFAPTVSFDLHTRRACRVGACDEKVNACRVAERDGRDVAPSRKLGSDEVLAGHAGQARTQSELLRHRERTLIDSIRESKKRESASAGPCLADRQSCGQRSAGIRRGRPPPPDPPLRPAQRFGHPAADRRAAEPESSTIRGP